MYFGRRATRFVKHLVYGRNIMKMLCPVIVAFGRFTFKGQN
jgi:hypothetical protein